MDDNTMLDSDEIDMDEDGMGMENDDDDDNDDDDMSMEQPGQTYQMSIFEEPIIREYRLYAKYNNLP